MLDDPGVDVREIGRCLDAQYGVRAVAVVFEPRGFDMSAAVYTVCARDGVTWFLKIRFGDSATETLEVPAALVELGVPNILAPVRTTSGRVCGRLYGHNSAMLILYPYIKGSNAVGVGLSSEQWRIFGHTLRAVHDSGLHNQFRDQLDRETFALPVAAEVQRLLEMMHVEDVANGARSRFAALLQERSGQIEQMAERAETLGQSLQRKPFEAVLCHADIHAANILVGNDGSIHLIDWDGPMTAPRERDLLFVIGSQIARRVEPHEKRCSLRATGEYPSTARH